MKKGNKRIFIFFILLYIIIALPHFLLQKNGLDAGWNFSYATNFTDGLYNKFCGSYPPYIYPYFQIPFYITLPNIYGSIVFHLFTILSIVLILTYQTGLSNKSFVLAAIVLSSHNILVFRSEHFSILMALSLYLYINKGIKQILVIFTITCLIHPAHSLLIGIALLGVTEILFTQKNRILIMFFLVMCALIGIHNIWPTNIYTSSLWFKIQNLSILPFLNFLKFNVLSIILLLFLAFDNWNNRKTYTLIIIFLFATLFNTSNYFALIYVPLIIYAIQSNNYTTVSQYTKIILTLSIMMNCLHPIISLAENPSYVHTSRLIQSTLPTIKTDGKLFVETYYGAHFYNRDNARMIFISNEQILIMDTIASQDKIILTSKKSTQMVGEFLLEKHPHLTYEVKNILPEVKGRLSLTSLYQKRTEKLGLYAITIL